MNENKKYYVKGGVACDFNDCFACEDEKCTLLKVSYKEDEICPFYKSISKDDVITEALTSTYNYAIRRENELAKQIEEKEQIIKELEDATKKTIKQLTTNFQILMDSIQQHEDASNQFYFQKMIFQFLC